MKRCFSAIVCLLLLMSGCSTPPSEAIENPVRFYYLKNTISYDDADGVIAVEIRDSEELPEDLASLTALYLAGPSDNQLVSPFPEGITLKSFSLEENKVFVTLSNNFTVLDNFSLTVACACITKTLLELTPGTTVEIRVEAGAIRDDELSILMDAESLVLFDNASGTDDKHN